MKTSVTINDIAEQLGLSRNTVAKALNGKNVKEKTRKLVFDKARELNYKSMKTLEINDQPTKRHRIVLISGKPLSNIAFFVPIIKGIENTCFDRQFELFQYMYSSNSSQLSAYLDEIRPDGIIAIESFDRDFIIKLLKYEIPVCFFDFTSSSLDYEGSYDIIEVSNRAPIFSFVESAIRKYGLRKFSFVGDIDHCLSFKQRYMGMIEALSISSIPHDIGEDILKTDNFNYGNPEAILSEIVKKKEIADIFICANDFIARSTINALKLIGRDCPSKSMVIGYDNVGDSTSSHPTITTFTVDKEYIGHITIKTILDRIADPKSPNKEIVIGAKRVDRESTSRDIAIQYQ